MRGRRGGEWTGEMTSGRNQTCVLHGHQAQMWSGLLVAPQCPPLQVILQWKILKFPFKKLCEQQGKYCVCTRQLSCVNKITNSANNMINCAHKIIYRMHQIKKYSLFRTSGVLYSLAEELNLRFTIWVRCHFQHIKRTECFLQRTLKFNISSCATRSSVGGGVCFRFCHNEDSAPHERGRPQTAAPDWARGLCRLKWFVWCHQSQSPQCPDSLCYLSEPLNS